MNAQEKNERITSLDALKGIGALGVIIGHYGAEGINVSIAQNMIGNGVRAVQLFFIISTFLCMKSINSHNPYTRKEYGMWLGNNLVRIAPLWYLAIILYGIWPSLGGMGGYSSSRSVAVIANYFTHFTFTSGFIPTHSNTIVEIGWYIGALVFVYIFVMLYHKYEKRLRLELLFILSIAICIISALGSVFFKTYVVVAYFRRHSIWAQLPVIITGMCVYKLLIKMNSYSVDKNESLSMILRITSTILIVSLFTVNLASPLGQISFGICFGMLVLSLLLNQKSALNNKILRLYGKYSLSIYLLHPILITLIRSYGVHIGNIYASWFINCILICIGALAFGILAHYLIEVPIRVILDWYNRRR